MTSLARHPYCKMNGLGNSFVILDIRQSRAVISSDAARLIADPKTGPGCDQVISIEYRKGIDSIFMGVWNADGSEVAACGNAARCVASLLMEEANVSKMAFTTGAGLLKATAIGSDRIAVDMGEPKFHWRDIPLSEQMDDTRFIDIKLGPIDAPVLWGPSAVNVGNPHCIFFVEDVQSQALDRFGPLIENHPLFPERANVSVAEVKSAHSIRLRVWERGAGITKACGSAACAVVAAANRRRLTARKATVMLDGGNLAIEWREDNHITMTGPVAFDGEGELSDDF